MSRSVRLAAPAASAPNPGASVPRVVALTVSAGMAGYFAPDVVMDVADHVGQLFTVKGSFSPPRLPSDFFPRAVLAGVGTFNTAWFMGAVLLQGRSLRLGAPLEDASTSQ